MNKGSGKERNKEINKAGRKERKKESGKKRKKESGKDIVTPRRLTLSSGAATGGDRPAARHVTTVHRDRTTICGTKQQSTTITFFMRYI